MSQTAIDAYNAKAQFHFDRYEEYDAAAIHSPWLAILPNGGTAIDVGAGSLRDANMLRQQGFNVTVVEPATELLNLGLAKHGAGNFEVIDDRLPNLSSLGTRQFDVVWNNNILMHMPLEEARVAAERLITLTKPEGILVIGIRLGPPDTERNQHAMTLDDILPWFTGTTELCRDIMTDPLGRADIQFLKYAVRVPTI
jgi:2-polyprenyl-3-methyl-5-hydroxy-6-metoxy-1,4-benzoquinol methylase